MHEEEHPWWDPFGHKEEAESAAEAKDQPPAKGSFVDDIKDMIDPWDGAHPGVPIPAAPIPQPKEYYDNLDLKKIPELDNYDELATQHAEVQEQKSSLELRTWEKEKIEDALDVAEDLKDSGGVGGIVGGVAEQAAEERLAAIDQGHPVDYSPMGEVYKDGVTPDPEIVAEYRADPRWDTYEELEASYKEKLWERDQTFDQARQEALGDVAEDVGDGLGGFVEQVPFVGDAAEDAADLAVEGAEEYYANNLTESEEASIEIHSPENDPGMVE